MDVTPSSSPKVLLLPRGINLLEAHDQLVDGRGDTTAEVAAAGVDEFLFRRHT